MQIIGLDLGVLYGAPAVAAAGTNPVLALRQAVAGQAKGIAAEAKRPEVQRDIAAFRAAVAGAKDPKALLANPVVLRVLLTANGLGDQAGYKALATKALLSGAKDPKGLANALPDPRWKSAAATLDFAGRGLAVLRDPKVLDTLVNAYAEISWRKSLDAMTPGLSDALTFRATAAKARTVDAVLGDATLDVVYATRRFVDANPGITAAFLQAMDTACAQIADDPAAAADTFIRMSAARMAPDEALAMVRDPDTHFSATPNGVMRYAEFMHAVGSIKVRPAKWSEMFVPALADRAGS